ncbi:hypothetical protein RND81_07G187300 [Saponaria officinalis]|uniref:Thioredoxin domain-containing protein n=1 Tax=Saponaria officinalis TaxID=3572 RepID=A0AAW1JUU8_SAPOF
MGGNYSRPNEGRTQVDNATLITSYNNKPYANHWSNVPENRAPTFACAPYPSTYRAPTKNNDDNNNSNNYNSEFKSYRPLETVASTMTAATTNRVTAFHSAARWREYFEASKHSNKLVVIYFTATWCGPCKHMEPTIKDLAAKYIDVDIVKIDVDELFNVSREFGVQTMPTFMFIKNGRQIDKVVGANKEELQRKIEKLRV